jgi:hypothetical protein
MVGSCNWVWCFVGSPLLKKEVKFNSASAPFSFQKVNSHPEKEEAGYIRLKVKKVSIVAILKANGA